MIEINLLPGKRKQAKGGGASVNFAGMGQSIVSKVKDPYLIGSMATAIAVALIVGFMFLRQEARERSLLEKEQKAVQDSTRYAAVLKERRKALAQRDSVVRQLNIIKAIDNDRYTWPHLMDEVSKALPPYTWLNAVQQTSIAPTASSAAGDGEKPDSAPPTPPLKFRIAGNTVDIQALTRFMRMLEQSPFIQNVTLSKSDLVVIEGKEVTDFSLEAEFQRPDTSAIRRVPLALTVR